MTSTNWRELVPPGGRVQVRRGGSSGRTTSLSGQRPGVERVLVLRTRAWHGTFHAPFDICGGRSRRGAAVRSRCCAWQSHRKELRTCWTRR